MMKMEMELEIQDNIRDGHLLHLGGEERHVIEEGSL